MKRTSINSLIVAASISILSLAALADDNLQPEKLDAKPHAEVKPHSHSVDKGTAPSGIKPKQDIAPMDAEARAKLHNHQRDMK